MNKRSTSFCPDGFTMVELLVAELALDCRQENERKAVVRIVLRVLRDGEIVGLEKGEGFADAGDGNYGAAFSKAFSDALSVSLSRLP